MNIGRREMLAGLGSMAACDAVPVAQSGALPPAIGAAQVLAESLPYIRKLGVENIQAHRGLS